MVTKKQRQRQLAREKWERQQARKIERQRRTKRRAKVAGAVLGVVAVVALVFGVVQLVRDDAPAAASDDKKPSATPTPTPTSTPKPETAPRPAATGKCEYVRQNSDDEKFAGLPPADVPPASEAEPATATIQTDAGTIEAELLTEEARCAVNSFAYLAEKDAYDRSLCTYLSVDPAEHLALGCGDLTGSGAGGAGYIFGNENDKTDVKRGWLVMAGPENRNDSRFYITYGDVSKFEEPVTVFGRVTSGMDVVDKLADKGLAVGSGTKGVGRPATSAVVQDVKVTS